MAQIDSLAPDRRAVLSLILRQGKTYEELAGILHIEGSAVRERAHAALEALGPRDSSGLTEERRGEISDFLLSQQRASERATTRAHLERSAAARAWARVVAAELRPLAGETLPEIPSEAAGLDEDEDGPPRPPRAPTAPSSRVGGALLLLGLGILIAVVLVLVLSGGGSSKHATSTGAVTSTPPSTSAQTTPGAQPQIIGQVNLTPPHGGSALGVANLLSQAGQRARALQAQGLAASTASSFYAVWLYNSAGDAQRLGFAPPVGSDGRLQAVSALPTGAARFHELILTRESQRQPSRPGQIVLAGPLSVPAA